MNPVCFAHGPYSIVCSLPGCTIFFPRYLKKRHDFSKNATEYKMCVLILSTTVVWNISHSKKNWARYDQKRIWVVIQSTGHSCQILTKLEFPREIFRKYAKLMKTRPVGAELFHTDRQTDMTKLTVAILNFSKAPNNQRADHHDRAAWAWVCGCSIAGTGRFESRRGHGCLSLMIVVCCQVEVSGTDRSFVQRSPANSGVCEYDL